MRPTALSLVTFLLATLLTSAVADAQALPDLSRFGITLPERQTEEPSDAQTPRNGPAAANGGQDASGAGTPPAGAPPAEAAAPGAPSSDAPAAETPAADTAPSGPQGAPPAQTPAGGDGSTEAATPEEGAATPPTAHGAPSARGAASGEQAAAAPAEAGQAEAAPPAEAAPAPEEPLGTRVGEMLRYAVLGLFTLLVDGLSTFRANFRRLGGLSEVQPVELWQLLAHLAPPVLTAGFVAVGVHYTIRPIQRRLGVAFEQRRTLGKIALAVLKIALDLLVVVVAIFAASAATQGTAGLDPVASAYLGAFLIAGMLITVIRAVLSPTAPQFRLFPIGDESARYWTRRLGVVVVLIILAEMLVPVAVRQLTTPITARSVSVAVYTIAFLYMAWLVFVNRREPAQYYEDIASSREDDVWAAFVAFLVGYWHIPVLVFLAFFFQAVVTDGDAAVPILGGIVRVFGALVIAGFLVNLLGRVAQRGVHLSPQARRALPGVEERLNLFLQPFLRVVRYLIAALLVLVVLRQAVGARIWEMTATRFGVDLLNSTASVLLIIVLVALSWVAIDAFIAYRLTPRRSHIPSARESTVLSLIRNASLVVLLLFGAYYALLEIGISLAPLVASAGVIALAISWGSQKLVQDVITGLFIQLENAINVGDVVEAGGKIGTVEKLTVRSVSLRDVQGVFHMIPFSSVDSVSNYMRGFSFHVADINVAYDTDIDLARRTMMDAYDELAGSIEWGTKLLGGIEWFGVEALSNSSIILRARIKTVAGEQWAVGRAYTEVVKRRFDAAGIEIPFQQMKLWVGEHGLPVPGPEGPPTRQTIRPGAPTDADDGGGDTGGGSPDSR